MRRRRDPGGRFVVGDEKSFTVSTAALSYAQDQTHRDGLTRYVREIGRQGALYIVEHSGGVTLSRGAA